MSEEKLKIRNAEETDAERLVEIYAYYVESTAVSFEYKVPTVSEFKERIRNTKNSFPYLVCLYEDKIIGYAYAGSYSSREAYNWTATTSIYVDRDFHRKKAGTLLYAALEEKLKKQGIINVLAGVAYVENEDEYLSHDSPNFHMNQGYTKVAHMKKVGKKFNRWYDLMWFQKTI